MNDRMTYDQALEFVYNVSWKGRKRVLERIIELLRIMGSPEKKLKYAHVAGTNGKGSTSAMLERVLRESGYRTGLYTSPYLLRFNERMRVNGLEISDEELIDNAMELKKLVAGMDEPPTFFETATALGFKYFLDHQCDIVVLEVGLGGRLDATNVIEAPEASVITTIGLEHTEELGTTKARIAVEKAGIIKPGRPVVVQTRDPEALKSILARAWDVGAPVWRFAADPEFLGVCGDRQHFRYRGAEYDMGLLGRHQLMNAATVIETAEVLRREGYAIPPQAVRAGISKTVWKGRFQPVLSGRMVVDGAHNPEGARSAVSAFGDYRPGGRPVALFGCLADKDWRQILDTLSTLCAEFLLVPLQNPRALDPAEARAYLDSKGVPARCCATVAEGIEKSLARGEELGTAVLAAGSLYLASEVLTALGEQNSQM